ncbi:hypothetical protein LPJ59_002210 [Coemansia sp. RSA 2399]|nr:hypothetical protein LPJ59_002210 [Coemansia sp. RSA 2399]KAJ1905800.1 hypothetical protein LPJ81_001724 [Coemansia sp. IMI 209127]
MDDYQDMTVQDPRYARHHHSHYAQANTMVHAQAAPSGPVAGYEWSAYPANHQHHQHHDQDAYMHGTHSMASRQPLAPSYSTAKSTTQPLRNKISERLHQIDREAFETEERRYHQRAEEIQNEMLLILRGTHPVFVDGVAQLAANRDRSLATAEHNHQYLVEVYEKTYRMEREQAERAYKSEKQTVYERIAADIEDRRKRLREEKDSVDISADFVFDSGSRSLAKRNLRKRGIDPLGLGDSAAAVVGSGSTRNQNKRKNAQPFLLQGIPEDDIVSDLVALRRATGVTGPLSGAANGKKSGKANKR